MIDWVDPTRFSIPEIPRLRRYLTTTGAARSALKTSIFSFIIVQSIHLEVLCGDPSPAQEDAQKLI